MSYFNYCRNVPKEVTVFSVDIFDTLLLRHCSCELLRFYEVAKIIKERLHLKAGDLEICKARIESARLAYHISDKVNNCREPNITDIYEMMFGKLGLDKSCIGEAISYELEYEVSKLKANTKLVDFLLKKREEGCIIIGISDMYLEQQHIEYLVGAVAGGFKLDKLYSSANIKVNKASSQLFIHVMNDMNIVAKQITHCGDNKLADYISPKSLGIRSAYMPRNIVWCISNKLSHYRMLRKLGVA